MQYIAPILSVALIHLLAVMSPGPDFIMILRNSLVYSRRSGVYSAIGLGLGIAVHVTYCLAGIALIIAQSVVVFNVLKYISAAYLLYIGIKSLRARREREVTVGEHEKKDLTKWQAVRMGFVTNVTNPKATLFFLSLFTLVISPTTPLFVKLIMGIEMVLATMLWFALLAVVVSHRSIRHRVHGFQHHLERAMGSLLVLLAIKVATTHSK